MKIQYSQRIAQHRWLWLLLAIVLLVLGLWPVAAASQPPIIHRWQIEPIAAGRPEVIGRAELDGAAILDLALDSIGRPHVIFHGPDGNLQYAWRDAGGWVIRPMFSGQNPSLALDAAGQPHVTFYDSAQERVIFVRPAGDEWVVVRTFEAAAPANALELDAAGNPHIAYLSPGDNPDERKPVYARHDGHSWTEQVLAEDRRPETIVMALDDAGLPVVAYDNLAGTTLYQILAARPGAGPYWQETVVDQWEFIGESFYEWRPDTLQMASYPGGNPVLAYAIGIEFLIKPSPITYDVFVYRLSGDMWQGMGGTYLATLGYGESAAPASLSVAADGPDRAFVGMVIGGDFLVGETNPEADNFWQSILWQKVAPAGGFSSLSLGADGQPRAAYTTMEGPWYATRYEIVLDHAAFLPVIPNNWSAPAYPGYTSVVSINSEEQQIFGESDNASISADGRIIAFESDAGELARDGRSWIMNPDIYVRDRVAGLTWNVTGHGPMGASHNPVVSADGRFVAFESNAHLAPGDSDNGWDIYLYELATRQTTLISDTPDLDDEYPDASDVSISASGRFIAFQWGLKGVECVVVHDRLAGAFECASVDSFGEVFNGVAYQPVISADGRFVAFAFSGDSQFPGDDNGVDDVFLHDRQTGETSRVSISTNGDEPNGVSSAPEISANGRFVVFVTAADNLASNDKNGALDVYRHDRLTGETVWVSRNIDRPGADSLEPSISADGRLVAFVSYASFGYAGDTNDVPDVFATVVGGRPMLLSTTWGGDAGNGASTKPVLSSTGEFVVFRSNATDLVAYDRSDQADIFLREGFWPVD